MRTTPATRAGLLSLAAAATLTLAPAAHAAPAAPDRPAAPRGSAQETAPTIGAAAKWHNIKTGSRRDPIWSLRWKRPAGVRVMQVKARCWDSRASLTIRLAYRKNASRIWKTIKTTQGRCNGRYHYARINNAGHTHYDADMFTNHRGPGSKTIQYWVQYYR